MIVGECFHRNANDMLEHGVDNLANTNWTGGCAIFTTDLGRSSADDEVALVQVYSCDS